MSVIMFYRWLVTTVKTLWVLMYARNIYVVMIHRYEVKFGSIYLVRFGQHGALGACR